VYTDADEVDHVTFLQHQVIGVIVRENVCNNSKKRKKSCFFGFWKKRKKT